MARSITLSVGVFVVLVCVSTRHSHAKESEALTGNGLIGSCRISVRSMEDKSYQETTIEAWRDGYCMGIIQGVSKASPHVCLGSEVTVGQETRMVLKYLEDHPKELHLENDVLVEKALTKAFPCAK